MTNKDRYLLSMMNGGRVSHADAAAMVADEAPIPNKTGMTPMVGNPPFIAQYDLQVLVYYFTVAAGVFTSRTAAYVLANAPALATKLSAFMYSLTDSDAGFVKSQGQFPLNGGWAYERPFVYWRDEPATSFGNLDATAIALLQKGDMVNVITATVAGPVNYVALVVVRCNQVGYATHLKSLYSDIIRINNIRYTLVDTSTAGLTQYNNQLYIQVQTLMGKYNSDFISPTSLKQPQQFQNGIIDIPIEKGIDKNVGVATYINYDSVTQTFSYFVSQLNKWAA